MTEKREPYVIDQPQPQRSRRPSRQGQRDKANRRRAQVAECIMLGMRQTEIAEKLGVSPSLIYYDLAHLRQTWYREHVEAANGLVAEDMERLSRGMAIVFENLVATRDSRALDALTRASELRWKALGVLPAGIKVDLNLADIRQLAQAHGFDPDHAEAVATRLLAEGRR